MYEVSLKQRDFRGKVFLVTVKQLIIVEHMVVPSKTIMCIRNLLFLCYLSEHYLNDEIDMKNESVRVLSKL